MRSQVTLEKDLKTLNMINYIMSNDATIRKTATEFNMSKSTVHDRVRKYLVKTKDVELINRFQYVMNEHFNNRHINGGKATKAKYGGIKWKS